MINAPVIGFQSIDIQFNIVKSTPILYFSPKKLTHATLYLFISIIAYLYLYICVLFFFIYYYYITNYMYMSIIYFHSKMCLISRVFFTKIARQYSTISKDIIQYKKFRTSIYIYQAATAPSVLGSVPEQSIPLSSFQIIWPRPKILGSRTHLTSCPILSRKLAMCSA